MTHELKVIWGLEKELLKWIAGSTALNGYCWNCNEEWLTTSNRDGRWGTWLDRAKQIQLC